jgi:hypothetical protein
MLTWGLYWFREREHVQMPTWQFGLVQEKFKDIKGMIRSRTSKKDRQCNGQKEKRHKNPQ